MVIFYLILKTIYGYHLTPDSFSDTIILLLDAGSKMEERTQNCRCI